MSKFDIKNLPEYDGKRWSKVHLPDEYQNWLDEKKYSIRVRTKGYEKTRKRLEDVMAEINWKWPSKEIIFISDLHADADSLLSSLLSSGGIRLTGSGDSEFRLTKKGKESLFLFGGDFFDKGPSNLRLLRVLRSLIKSGAKVKILAGNHDVRVMFGMRSLDNTDDPRNGHFFVRMGVKAIPFLREIRDLYLNSKKALEDIPSESECLERMLPKESWHKHFREFASWVMPKERISLELEKIDKKSAKFKHFCERHEISIQEAYAAAKKWQDLFLEPDGEFYWFFQSMELAYQKGSFLFVHAGLDDRIATMLNDHGVNYLNKAFKRQLFGSPFEFYYGPLANTIRTKYRPTDMPLTLKGAQQIKRAGIDAVVHGHRNLHHGQRIALRKQILHFECDITLDRHSRRAEGLQGIGGGATLIQPTGNILGISNDHKKIKVFSP